MNLPRTCLYAALMALSALALAQQKVRPDPGDAKVSVPPVIYISPLKQYQPLGDEQVLPWKGSNEVVEKAGGWKAYAREAQQPAGAGKAVAPTSQPAPPEKPAAHEHPMAPKKN